MTEVTNPDDRDAALYCEKAIRVQGYDIDFAGIVHNTVFIRWLEDLRVEWCDRYLPLSEQIAEGYVPIVASTEIAYKTPIRFSDPVTGKLWMTRRGIRWIVDIEIWNNDKLAARARQTGAFVSMATLKPIPIPARLAAEFARVREAGEH